MKMTVCVFVVIITYGIGLMSGCTKKETVESDTPGIEFLSFENKGCNSSNTLLKTHDEAVFYWHYYNTTLQLDVLFSPQCEAMMKDSVIISENIINIFLVDTSHVAAHCVCVHKESFNFKIEGKDEITVLFSYKPYSKTDYYLLADSIIILR